MVGIRSAVLFALVAAAGACGGSSSDSSTTPSSTAATVGDGGPPVAEPAGDPEKQEIDYEEVDLPASSNFLPLLKVGAEGVGCALVAEEADGLAYQCEEGLIFMVQKGAKLRYACENVPPDRCGVLMQRITDKMIEAAGG